MFCECGVFIYNGNTCSDCLCKIKDEQIRELEQKSEAINLLYISTRAENEKLRSILHEFLTTEVCSQTWIEEMYSTIEAVLGEKD
ncbi:MAG: hypothetical protein DRI84_06355 [Bacteroidetes bacterium]|nr:MAG: hypothetical protein DRI84_06355 [Bacteroidota bacterium]